MHTNPRKKRPIARTSNLKSTFNDCRETLPNLHGPMASIKGAVWMEKRFGYQTFCKGCTCCSILCKLFYETRYVFTSLAPFNIKQTEQIGTVNIFSLCILFSNIFKVLGLVFNLWRAVCLFNLVNLKIRFWLKKKLFLSLTFWSINQI